MARKRQQIGMNADGGLKDLVARIDERTQTTADDVGQIKHVLLEGNGSPPLTAVVARLDERMKSVEVDKTSRKLSGSDRAVVFTALISGMISMIEMLFRHIHG